MPDTTRPAAASYRLGETDINTVRRLADHLTEKTGVTHSQADVIRVAVRDLARREGLDGGKKNRDKR